MALAQTGQRFYYHLFGRALPHDFYGAHITHKAHPAAYSQLGREQAYLVIQADNAGAVSAISFKTGSV
jgi:hypothetical protein